MAQIKRKVDKNPILEGNEVDETVQDFAEDTGATDLSSDLSSRSRAKTKATEDENSIDQQAAGLRRPTEQEESLMNTSPDELKEGKCPVCRNMCVIL